MPLNNYAIIKARPIRTLEAGGDSPHYQVHINDGGVNYRIAINARSTDTSEVMFLHKRNLSSDIFPKLKKLQNGLHWKWEKIGEQNISDLCIDYKRSSFILNEDELKAIAYTQPGDDNDLNDYLNGIFKRCMSDGNITLYVFGQVWGPGNQADKYFGILPGLGIHDIHYNQGNPQDGRFSEDNGIHQDGCILIETRKRGAQSEWEGIFLKFQTQSWNTDNNTGHPIS